MAATSAGLRQEAESLSQQVTQQEQALRQQMAAQQAELQARLEAQAGEVAAAEEARVAALRQSQEKTTHLSARVSCLLIYLHCWLWIVSAPLAVNAFSTHTSTSATRMLPCKATARCKPAALMQVVALSSRQQRLEEDLRASQAREAALQEELAAAKRNAALLQRSPSKISGAAVARMCACLPACVRCQPLVLSAEVHVTASITLSVWGGAPPFWPTL